MSAVTRLAAPRGVKPRDSLPYASPRKAGRHLLTLLGVAAAAAVLIPTSGLSQGPVPDRTLKQEWLQAQVEVCKQTRQVFWRNLDLARLTAYIKAGADVTVADKRGWTPLHSAARYHSNPEIVAALLEAGAAVDAKDRAGDTALHWAAAENTNAAVVYALLQAGADVNARDKYGWLPIHTAAERNSNPDVIDALLTAGANRNERAYFILFRPAFLLRHNANMSDRDKEFALALLIHPE